MTDVNLCFASVRALSELVSKKQVSPVEIIEAHLQRISETEPVLNSFITLLADEAQEAARRAEAMINRGNHLGPLHGIPVGLKDLFNTCLLYTSPSPRD